MASDASKVGADQAAALDLAGVEVRRSARRKRTVTAFRENGRIVVLMPQRLSRTEEQRWVRDMVARVQAREARARINADEDQLFSRALNLHEQYLAAQVSRPVLPRSVVWVTNQNHRWGSCTPGARTIRLSHRLQRLPAWVVDYVLLHELAHLYEGDHSARFWRLLAGYPRTEQAKGYLLGWVDGHGAPPQGGSSTG